jgi:CubicO group peptidase (beta-lactamase class C family)
MDGTTGEETCQCTSGGEGVVCSAPRTHDCPITCDAVGSAIHDGGISATARDLARFGQLLLDDGSRDGHAVVPAAWLADSRHPTPAVRQAFANTDNDEVLTGGWYRNQFWFVPTDNAAALVYLGIHGQMICVNPFTRVVGVQLSSWPEAQNGAHLIDTLRAFGAIGVRMSAKAPAHA